MIRLSASSQKPCFRPSSYPTPPAHFRHFEIVKNPKGSWCTKLTFFCTFLLKVWETTSEGLHFTKLTRATARFLLTHCGFLLVPSRVFPTTFQGGLHFPIFPRWGLELQDFWAEVGVRVARFSGAKRPKTAPKAPFQKNFAFFRYKTHFWTNYSPKMQ